MQDALHGLVDNVQNETDLEKQIISRVETEIKGKLDEMEKKRKLKKPKSRLEQKQQQELEIVNQQAMQGETRKEYLVRMGRITPMGVAIDEEVKSESGNESTDSECDVIENIDDGNEAYYQQRLNKWSEKRVAKRAKYTTDSTILNDEEEFHLPILKYQDKVLSNQFKIPGELYHKLFDYQRTSLRWFWELHRQKVGGVLGDEMVSFE